MVVVVEVEVEVEVIEVEVEGRTRRDWVSEVELYCWGLLICRRAAG